MNRMIRNVNVLDLSSATKESLEGIRAIGDINLLIVHPEISTSLATISLRNVNQIIEGVGGVKVINGRLDLPMSS